MREMSVAEQRYLAVLAVIAEGHEVSSVAQQCEPPRVQWRLGSATSRVLRSAI